MAERPFHHGNLRAALLGAAERTLREDGIEHISLRDLARRTDVSHSAPRRHFRDRQALLDALAELGFDRLAGELATAISNAGKDFEAQLRAAASTFVRFAIDDAPLLDLMRATKEGDEPGRPYVILGDLIHRGRERGELRPGDPERLRLIIIATFQGIAGLVASGRVPDTEIEPLVTDATSLFVNNKKSQRRRG